jgi:hypothetical protein
VGLGGSVTGTAKVTTETTISTADVLDSYDAFAEWVKEGMPL